MIYFVRLLHFTCGLASYSPFLVSYSGQLETMGVGWSTCNKQTGSNFIHKLTQALWYIDPHHSKFVERGIHLPDCFSTYKGYNDFKRKKEKEPRLSREGLEHIKSHQQSPQPVPNETNASLVIIPANNTNLSEYHDLGEKLLNLPLYEPFYLNEIAPVERYQRRKWLAEISVPFPVMLYKYAYGNNIGTLVYA